MMRHDELAGCGILVAVALAVVLKLAVIGVIVWAVIRLVNYATG